MRDIYSLPIEELLKVTPDEFYKFSAEQKRLNNLEYAERKKLKFRVQYWIDVFFRGFAVAEYEVNCQAFINVRGQEKFNALGVS